MEAPEAIPERLGRYVVTSHLGRGGMADVFKGKVVGLDGFERTVCIKRILPEYASRQHFVRMLFDEARITVALHHPNVVQCLDLGEADGTFYVVLEFVEGRDLENIWQACVNRRLRIPFRHALHVGIETAKGLSYAQRARGADGAPLNLVHRDLTPSNIFVSYEGDVKIGDFGVALASVMKRQEKAGGLVGKLDYMSPEQVRGEELDGRSDVFTLGISLFELVTMTRLFGTEDLYDLVAQMKAFDPDKLLKQHPTLPTDLVAVLQKAMATDREQRYPNAQAFHDELVDFSFNEGIRTSATDLAAFMADLYGRDRPAEAPVPAPKPAALPTAAPPGPTGAPAGTSGAPGGTTAAPPGATAAPPGATAVPPPGSVPPPAHEGAAPAVQAASIYLLWLPEAVGHNTAVGLMGGGHILSGVKAGLLKDNEEARSIGTPERVQVGGGAWTLADKVPGAREARVAQALPKKWLPFNSAAFGLWLSAESRIAASVRASVCAGPYARIVFVVGGRLCAVDDGRRVPCSFRKHVEARGMLNAAQLQQIPWEADDLAFCGALSRKRLLPGKQIEGLYAAYLQERLEELLRFPAGDLLGARGGGTGTDAPPGADLPTLLADSARRVYTPDDYRNMQKHLGGRTVSTGPIALDKAKSALKAGEADRIASLDLPRAYGTIVTGTDDAEATERARAVHLGLLCGVLTFASARSQ